jgi:hypothetical protein
MAASDPSAWACEACTFENVSARTVCEICETKRSNGVQLPVSEVSQRPFSDRRVCMLMRMLMHAMQRCS